MDYSEAANYLLGLRRFRTQLGTEDIARFLETAGNPQAGTDFVQIAGSNGKGSTARMLASVLREAGLDVGLYTSPDLGDVRERVQVNGRKIPKSAITEFVSTFRERLDSGAARSEPLTHFEALTALAIWYFGERDVDVAILEVGIGGQYDATSVVSPIASAVTNVSLEHTDVLGSTREEIARDKVHVAPEDGPLVTAADSVFDTLREHTDLTTVGWADTDVVVESLGRDGYEAQEITVRGEGLDLTARIPHLGRHQAENAGVAVALARQVTDVDPDTIARGLRKAAWPGRFEVMEQDPLVLLDGAHNPGASEQLGSVLTDLAYEDLYLVFGAMHDKDLGAMIEALPRPTQVFTCRPDKKRAEDERVLAKAWEAAGVDAVEAVGSVLGGVNRAINQAGPEDAVVIAGSLYTVAEARQRWARTVIPVDAKFASEADGTEPLAALDRAERPIEAADRRFGTVRTRLPRDGARTVQAEMLRAGGECEISALIEEARFVDVILSGTRTQFRTLFDALEDRDCCPTLPADIEAALGPTPTDFPGLDPAHQPALMGILNITPDSFHDGGEYNAVPQAIERAEKLIEDGADIIDVGGESTRPGADPVEIQAEIDRIVPVIEALQDLDAMISVDTRKAEVATAAIEAGADIINDQDGLEDPALRAVVAEHDVPVILMHSINTPVQPDADVPYDDVVTDVIAELKERVLLARRAGIDRDQIVLDPGIGFGKTAAENFELLDRLHELTGLGLPVLFAHSHKSLFADIGYADGDRLLPTVVASAMAAERGAAALRVHDVAENLAAVKTAGATDRTE
ncbi:dihydropteroate synthase [Halodesulfurarchaeum sp. HSR-GB]|uniref:dihydropteroate synthase n=1 Tax=Halodesulfurarchaeum sp. HSR-GB TaxID=3074077 RepID=UPI002863E239|nr:dihydropteroate synthase [Halodesulfurarchaeum sp. HSR-GB]MDR5656482.1 dihydropteroate synthase [Halodesulfurarchaeum sp. HSR-GB]